jgi:hypothetical protein
MQLLARSRLRHRSLSAGLIADAFRLAAAISSIAALTALSGTIVPLIMRVPEPRIFDLAQDIDRPAV